MKKKILLFTLLAVLCLSSISLANNIGQDLQNLGNDAGKMVENTANGIKNTTENIGNGIKDASNNIGLTNAMNDAGNEVRDSGEKIMGETQNTTNNLYTATRTSNADDTGSGLMNNNNVWIWAVAILAIVGIVAMLWYYFSERNQYDDTHR